MAQPPKPDPLVSPLAYTYTENGTAARQAFIERRRYARSIFPAASRNYTRAFNFWGDDSHYARINGDGNPIMVDNAALKLIGSTDGNLSLYALDCVSDAWSDLTGRIKELKAANKIYPSGPYAEATARRAWLSPAVAYHQYMVDYLYPAFQESFMAVNKRRKSLRDFDSFLKLFTDFARTIIESAGPITYSGFMESIYCSPLVTGLAIELASVSHDNDFTKEKDFLYDANYDSFVKLATQYGFGIDKNAPWRIVFDPASPAGQEYLFGVFTSTTSRPPVDEEECDDKPTYRPYLPPSRPFGYSKIPGFEDVKRFGTGYIKYKNNISQPTTTAGVYSGFFGNAYTETWNHDLEFLKPYLIDFYNRYVAANRYITIKPPGPDSCEPPEVIVREFMPPDMFSKQNSPYRNKWSLKTYYILRRAERNIEESIANEVADIREMYSYYDNIPAATSQQKFNKTLEYTRKRYIQAFDPGNLTDLYRKDALVIFQTLDDKTSCVGIYTNGRLWFEEDSFPEDLTTTWDYVPYMDNSSLELASLYLQGKPIGNSIPEFLQDDWEDVSLKLESFKRSFDIGKINLEQNCFYDLVPQRFLIELCEVRNKITQHVLEKIEKPKRYEFYKQVRIMLGEIEQHQVNTDKRFLKSFLNDSKFHRVAETIMSAAPFVRYNQFGTKTGRLSCASGAFPILTLPKALKSSLQPTNDFYLELDFNGAEVRTLLGLLEKPQPTFDVHEFHQKEVFEDRLSREEAKIAFFAWLYGSNSHKDSASNIKLQSFYDREKLLKAYWNEGVVKTFYGKEIPNTSKHHALNYIIQSTAAELTLKQSLKVHHLIKTKGTGSFLAFIVHDSIVIDMKKEDLRLLEGVLFLMGSTNFGNFLVNKKIGKNLGNMKEFSHG